MVKVRTRATQRWMAGTVLAAAVAAMTPASALAAAELHTPRNAYYRGEIIPVTVHSDAGGGETVRLFLNEQPVAAGTLGDNGQAMLRVPTDHLKSSQYELRAEIQSSDGTQAGQKDIHIARRPNPDRMDVWLWPHKAFLDSMKNCDAEATKKLDYWIDVGWNNFAFGEGVNPTIRQFWDHALARGLDVCLMPAGGLNDVKVESSDPDVKFKGADGAVIKDGKIANPFHPAVARWQDEQNEKLMLAAIEYPNVSTAFFNTEVIDGLVVNGNEAGRRLTQDQDISPSDAGAPEKLVAPGVIADDDPRYRYNKFFFTQGSGLPTANARTAAMIHRYRPDVLTMNDPYRQYALLDGFPGIDAIGTWTYVNPDPKLMHYVETLHAVCRDDGGKLPFSTVTFLNYPGELAPTETWMTIDAGRLAVCTWINLSRAPRLLSYYVSSGCDPFGALEDDLKTPKPADPFVIPPETFDRLRELSERVFKPHGGLIKKLSVSPRRTAVLSSAAAGLHSKSPRLLGHYDNMQAYHLYTVMAMAQIPADIVFDQSIERFGLDDYDVLVLPRCDVLTKSVYDRIIEFQKRGGVVIADQYLKAEIPGVIRFDFDFTYRDKVTAMAIAKNQKYANWNDQLKPDSAELTQVTAVTAHDDQRIMESYAKELRERLDGIVTRDVDCAEPTALLNLTEANGVKYLFVINDKREYGPRLGQYKAVLEKIVPQMVSVELLNVNDAMRAYDLIDGQELPIKLTDKGRSIDVSLGELGGKIIALYPTAIDEVAIRAPKEFKAGQSHVVAISMNDAAGGPLPGVQPLKVTVTDSAGNANEYTDYYYAERGALQIALTPAVNEPTGTWTLRVDDLTAGQIAETSFDVVP